MEVSLVSIYRLHVPFLDYNFPFSPALLLMKYMKLPPSKKMCLECVYVFAEGSPS